MTIERLDEGEETQDVDDHLADIDDGCGCAEIWEYLSDQRAAD